MVTAMLMVYLNGRSCGAACLSRNLCLHVELLSVSVLDHCLKVQSMSRVDAVKGLDLVGSELTPAAARIIVEEDLVPVFLGS